MEAGVPSANEGTPRWQITDRLAYLPSSLIAKVQTWKDIRVLHSDGIQGIRVEAERLENRRRDLHGLDGAGDGLGTERWVGEKHHHIGVIAREPAMLGKFLAASRVGHTNIRRGEDVRGSPLGGNPGALK